MNIRYEYGREPARPARATDEGVPKPNETYGIYEGRHRFLAYVVADRDPTELSGDSNSTINGQLISDAYIYRLTRPLPERLVAG